MFFLNFAKSVRKHRVEREPIRKVAALLVQPAGTSDIHALRTLEIRQIVEHSVGEAKIFPNNTAEKARIAPLFDAALISRFQIQVFADFENPELVRVQPVCGNQLAVVNHPVRWIRQVDLGAWLLPKRSFR